MIKERSRNFKLVERGLILSFGLLALSTFTGATEGNSTQIKALAESLATRLNKSNAKSLVVFDLRGPDGQSLPFGGWISDQLSSVLSAPGLQIEVIDRAKLSRQMHDMHLSQADLGLENEARIARALGASLFVDGTFGAIADHIGITLVARNPSDVERGIYTCMVTGKILLDQDVERHLEVPLESIQPHDGIYKSGRAGMTVPQCDYCPLPQFSLNAVWGKKQGTVVLALLISAEGIVTQIKLLKSVDTRLDDEAIRIAKSYRFHPALDPDGNPAAVLMPYTVRFQVAQ